MLTILFEDDDIVAVEKPSGVATIPERDLSKESVLSILEGRLGMKLFIVHRLDKEASGVVLFAKNAIAHRLLNKQFFERTVEKTYAALVLGRVQDDRGVIDAPIRQFGSGRMGVDAVRGKPSLTRYEVVQRFEATTLINAFPSTGRRHQIRVHCYNLGNPIAGDPFYGKKNVQERYSRLMLHAMRISFTSVDGQRITVESEVPREFYLQGLR